MPMAAFLVQYRCPQCCLISPEQVLDSKQPSYPSSPVVIFFPFTDLQVLIIKELRVSQQMSSPASSDSQYLTLTGH